jgi:hypothetical protein
MILRIFAALLSLSFWTPASADSQLDRLLQLEDGATTEADILRASCLSEAPTEAQFQNHWQSLRATHPSLERVRVANWIIARDTPPLIDGLRALIPEQSMENAGGAAPPRSCADAVCVAETIFGVRIGRQLLYLQSRYGYNASHLAFPLEGDPWTEQELDDVLGALGDFPQHLLPLTRDGKILRKLKHQGPPANSRIQLSGEWSELPRARRRYVIFHEVTHQLARLADLDLHPEWLKLTQ